jgi:hypothetical protein
MAHLKKKYSNGQSRGGTPGSATDTSRREGRHAKDYYRQMVSFHGGDRQLEEFIKKGRKGY